jgi:hypothetical protein
MLRAIAIAAALCTASPRAAANADEEQSSINAKDLRTYFEPYRGGVRDCYAMLKEGDGSLSLDLVIHRDGTVYRFGFEAGGLSPGAVAKLDRCLRPLSDTWHFPVRRGFTTAVIPFRFQRSPGGAR